MRAMNINTDAIVRSYRNGCCTNTTLRSVGQRELDRVDLSIHPRRNHGNTSMPPKVNAKGYPMGKLGKATNNLRRRRSDYMSTILSTPEARTSYHQPGSMNLG